MATRGAFRPGATPLGMAVWWQPQLVVSSWVQGVRGMEALGWGNCQVLCSCPPGSLLRECILTFSLPRCLTCPPVTIPNLRGGANVRWGRGGATAALWGQTVRPLPSLPFPPAPPNASLPMASRWGRHLGLAVFVPSHSGAPAPCGGLRVILGGFL